MQIIGSSIENIVFATGATEAPKHELSDYGRSRAILLSRDILAEYVIDSLSHHLEQYPDDRQIIILGGSHSGFSAANKLLDQLYGIPLTIDIFSRGEVKVFFNSEQEAQVAGYRYNPGDVCPKTGRVNRFSGLRSDAKSLYERIINSDETKVKLHVYEKPTKEIRETVTNAFFVVNAAGYQARDIPIYDSRGDRIGPHFSYRYGRVVVDGGARIYYSDWAEPIQGAYAIGLGHGIKPSPEIGGEPNAYNRPLDGVNIYHGPVGEKIVEQIEANGVRWV